MYGDTGKNTRALRQQARKHEKQIRKQLENKQIEKRLDGNAAFPTRPMQRSSSMPTQQPRMQNTPSHAQDLARRQIAAQKAMQGSPSGGGLQGQQIAQKQMEAQKASMQGSPSGGGLQRFPNPNTMKNMDGRFQGMPSSSPGTPLGTAPALSQSGGLPSAPSSMRSPTPSAPMLKKGGSVSYKSGGMVKSSASKRADGCAVKGKTKGKMV